MEGIKRKLNEFLVDPFDPTKNFDLGILYEREKQYASAYSYFLRCAEFTTDDLVACEALLRSSFCLGSQGGRCEKELHQIKHAITASPNSLEPYHVASLYHSWRRNWTDAYMYVKLALNILREGRERPKLKTDVKMNGVEDLQIQRARCASNIGKISEARSTCVELMSEYSLTDERRSSVNKALENLPEPTHAVVPYEGEQLIYVFEGSENVKHNYSQIMQDIFVLCVLDGKRDGKYLEIGSGNYKKGNNSLLLEELGWYGLSIDFNREAVKEFNIERTNPCIWADATKLDYEKTLSVRFDETIDYLQLDCDPPSVTYDILCKLPLDKYKFRVITYEHDHYNDSTGLFRTKSREKLESSWLLKTMREHKPLRGQHTFRGLVGTSRFGFSRHSESHDEAF